MTRPSKMFAFVVAAIVLSACTRASGSAPASPSPGGAARSAIPTASEVQGHIVFENDPLTPDGHRQLYIERADGSGVRRLVRSQFDDVSPVISPDGSEVAFTRQNDPHPDRIEVVNTDGSGLHQLVPAGCPSRCGDAVEGDAWSSDGSRIVFTRAVFGLAKVPAYVELWTANADGTGARRLTRESGAAQDDFAGWSPDGTRVVFVHWVYGSPDHLEVYTVAADGTDPRRVTPVGLDAADPAWSPDGSRILFQSPPDPGNGVVQNIYTVHPDGSGLRMLTRGLGGWPPSTRRGRRSATRSCSAMPRRDHSAATCS